MSFHFLWPSKGFVGPFKINRHDPPFFNFIHTFFLLVFYLFFWLNFYLFIRSRWCRLFFSCASLHSLLDPRGETNMILIIELTDFE
jgi:hypothetical protein